jgi:hypothetical protein
MIAEYMEGRQRIDKYKPLMGVDENANETWLNLNWAILPIVTKYIRISLGLLNKANYKIEFMPVDALATDEKNKYFATMKARLLLREEIQKAAPEQADEIIKQLGLEKLTDEPGDQEELEMQARYTYKHQAAIEMENDCNAVFAANKVDYLRKTNRQKLLYYGIAGFKDYIDTNGALKIRSIRPDNLIVSPCRNKDFSDLTYVGEVLEMNVEDFAQLDQTATKEQCIAIANQHAANNMMGSRYNSWEEVKRITIKVLNLEWFSIDEVNYEVNETKQGNKAVVRTKKTNGDFVRSRVKVLYKAKWVVGTDHVFDYGRATDMKRAKQQLADVICSYHLIAPSFYDMKINSIGQQLIPVIDQIQMDWLKLQQFKSEAKPKGVTIEMGALEDVKFGKGGEAMTPRELFDLFEKKSVVMWRRTDRSGKGQNLKPVEPLDFGGAQDVLEWFNSIMSNIQLLKDIIGLNDFTDASTPDPRALTTTANLAAQATNNSLYDIIDADIELMKRLAESVMIRLQDMEQLGLLDRYALSIGDNSIACFNNNPRVSHHDYAIEIKPVPTDEERRLVIEDAKALMGVDLLSYADIVMVKNMDNLKVAEQMLAWRLERRRKEKLQESMMLQQQNAEVQTQSAVAAEQAKQQTLQLKIDGDLRIEDLKGQWAVKVAEVNAGANVASKLVQNQQKEEMAESPSA